ncbi:MAG: DUF4469 domain-containing protein [Rectinemataceae bacterium]|jgi:hypothetical protein
MPLTIRAMKNNLDTSESPIYALASVPNGSDESSTTGGLVRVAGARMKFDPSDGRLGLFFKDEARIETRSEVYAQVQPSTILAVVPASLSDGSYRLVVRTVSKGGEILEGVAITPMRIRRDKF